MEKVCYLWYNVIRSTPQLWNTIDLYVDADSHKSLSHFRAVLKYTREGPLDINLFVLLFDRRISVAIGNNIVKQLFDDIAGHASKLQRLAIGADSALGWEIAGRIFKRSKGQLHNLYFLSFSIDWERVSPS
jgi:hypothetical protein